MDFPEDLYRRRARERRRAGRRFSFHWRQRWRAWIDRRLPPQRAVALHNKNLFIFPTRSGLGFLALLVLLLLLAINFENSPIYAMLFLLAGVFVVSILHTFANLSGLKVSGLDGDAAFAHSDTVFHFLLVAKHGAHRGVQLSWQDMHSERVDLEKHDEKRVSLRYRTGPRGICTPGRLKIESCFPLGLIRCWTWVDLKQQTLVYPRPDLEAGDPVTTNQLLDDEHEAAEHSLATPGSDDFYGLREYSAGDSIKNVAWRNYAKTGQLTTKQFVDHQDPRLWLDWEQASGDTEARLRQLCHWVIAAETGHLEYGLKMPGVSIAPARGKAHLRAVLSRLATYGLSTPAPAPSAAAGRKVSPEFAT